MPNIADMFANFSESSIALMSIVVAAAFFIGLLVTFKGILSLKEYADGGGRTQLKTPLLVLLTGVLLIALPGTINVATETLALGQNTGTHVLAETSSSAPAGMDSALRGILLFVKLIGHIAVVRGVLILKRGAEGQQESFGRGVTHILGGAAAININATVSILASVFGMPMPF